MMQEMAAQQTSTQKTQQTNPFQIPYREIDGILYPDLMMEEEKEEKIKIGRYGRLRVKYLKEHRQGTYQSLLLTGQLTGHLQQIDRAAEKFMTAIVTQLSKDKKVAQNLKSPDPNIWRTEMDKIKRKVDETVMTMLVNT